MSVTITWSDSAGGTGFNNVSHGTSTNGSTTTAKQIYIRHDGDNSITNCEFYFTSRTGSYTGDFDAATDFSELLGWGDAAGASDFGGIQINFDAIGSFSGGASWGMSESQKTSVDGLKVTVRTGVGDSSDNAITLPTEMSSSMPADGEIPEDVNTVTFQIRLKVPSSEDTLGVRQFNQFLKYDFTS